MRRTHFAGALLLATLAAGTWALFRDPGDSGASDPSTRIEGDTDEPTADAIASHLPRSGEPGESTADAAHRETAADGRITVRGRLVTKTRPVADVEVQLGPGDSPYLRFLSGFDGRWKGGPATRTTAAGEFAFRVKTGQPGSISIGDEQWVLVARVSFPGSSSDVDLGDIECTRTARITGRVHAGGSALKGVRVTVNARGAYQHARATETNEEGGFEFAGVPPGKCTILCSSGRHLSRQKDVVLEPGAARSLSIELEPGRSLLGQVLDDAGQPLADIEIEASGSHEETADGKQFVKGKTRSDKGGFFTLSGIAGKTVRVRASGNGVKQYTKNDVPVDGGPLVIRLTRLGSLSGTLVSEAGKPIAGSTITVRPDTDGGAELLFTLGPLAHFFGERTKTDGEGKFRLTGIEPGEVRLVATGDHAEVEHRGVTIRPGTETRDVLLHAALGGVVSVTVRDPDGGPVAGATVTAKTAGSPARLRVDHLDGRILVNPNHEGRRTSVSAQTKTVETDAKGRAVIYGLRAGKHELSARARGWLGASETSLVPRTGTHEVALQLGRGGWVEVRTLDEERRTTGGRPFRIRSKEKRGRTRSGRTDDAGRARIGPFRPGSYIATLQRTARSGRSTLAYSSAGRLSSSRGDLGGTGVALDVRAGATTKVTLVQPVLASLAGTVRDARGTVSGASVGIERLRRKGEPNFARHSSRITAGANGAFAFHDLEAGEWLLEFRRAGAHISFARRVEVHAGETTSVDLLLAGHTLHVALRSAGAAVADAEIRLRRLRVAGAPARAAQSTARSDKTGRAAFSELPSATYDLTVRHPRYVTETLPRFRVTGPERLTVELERCGALLVEFDSGERVVATRSWIRYRKKGTARWRTARITKGWCTIRRLPAGEYEIAAADSKSSRGAPSTVAPTTAVVRAGSTAKVRIAAR